MILFFLIIHVIICAGLIFIVLVQRGRGGGFVESFQGLETMFGTKTSVFLTKATAVLSTLFFISCLNLAFLSIKQSRSLLKDTKSVQKLPDSVPAPSQKSQAPEAPKN